jgi:hypothetical protein
MLASPWTNLSTLPRANKTRNTGGSARSGSNLEGFGQIRSNPDQTSLINYESSSTKCQCETHVMRHCLRELKNTFSFADKSGLPTSQDKLSQKKRHIPSKPSFCG